MDREKARELLYDWVKNPGLRKHCLGVAVCMEAYAKKFISEGRLSDKGRLDDSSIGKIKEGEMKEGIGDNNEEIIDKWYVTGLLHDFDWERYPTIEEHPIKGCEELRKREYPEDIIVAILSHNEKTGIKRYSLMAKTLFAVDELSGLVLALAKVRPGNFDGMSAKSVKKAMKKKDFAAAINRDDINLGLKELGLESDEDKDSHFELVISALYAMKEELGFDN